MHKRGKAPLHPLDILSETLTVDHNQLLEYIKASSNKAWNNIPDQAQNPSLAHTEVYLDKFIGFVQGGPIRRQQITRHFSHSINELLRPNNPLDMAREEPK